MDVGNHLDSFTYEALLAEALAQIPDTVDKRQGSIIYDTLAIGCAQLAQGFIQLKDYYVDSYALTARGKYLDLRVGEAGVKRYEATHAVKLVLFCDTNGKPTGVPLGTRLATTSDATALVYTVTAEHTQDGTVVVGAYHATCEIAGMAGNAAIGAVLPVSFVDNVASVTMTDLLVPARDTETDEDLLARYLDRINRPAFGGNVAQYQQWVREMQGVGAVQIYPSWNGGGTVKASVLGADYLPASDTLIQEVQTVLDPESNHGEGLGFAPIGHTVTVATPQAVAIDVDIEIRLRTGILVGQVQSQAQENISSYLLSLRKQFGASDFVPKVGLPIYRARITAAVMEVEGIENVAQVRINGKDEDYMLLQNPQDQQLPVDGVVTLHAI